MSEQAPVVAVKESSDSDEAHVAVPGRQRKAWLLIGTFYQSYDDYLRNLSRDGVYADDLCCVACSHLLHRPIKIISDLPDDYVIEFSPPESIDSSAWGGAVVLAFYVQGRHYEATQPLKVDEPAQKRLIVENSCENVCVHTTLGKAKNWMTSGLRNPRYIEITGGLNSNFSFFKFKPNLSLDSLFSLIRLFFFCLDLDCTNGIPIVGFESNELCRFDIELIGLIVRKLGQGLGGFQNYRARKSQSRLQARGGAKRSRRIL